GDEALCTDLDGWAGFTHPGGFQEQLVVPLERLLRVPDGIDPVTAAPMTCALGTAYRAVVTRGEATPGSTIAVIGLGGVGIHALQVAAATGSAAVGLDVSARACEVAGELGLHAIDSRSFELSDAGVDSVAEEGFDAVVVTAGAEVAYRQAAELVRRGGRVVCVGYAADAVFALATPRLVLDEIAVLGSRYVTRGELARAIDLVASGSVKPVVDAVRPVDEVNEAYDDLTNGRIVGRTVLRISDDYT